MSQKKSMASGELKVEDQMEGGLSVDMPAEFEGPMAPIIATRVNVPYCVFAQPKALEQWMELATKLPGLKDGDQVLIQSTPIPPKKITPLRFTIISSRQYQVQKDKRQQGKRLKVEPLTVDHPLQSKDDGWGEEIFASILIYGVDPNMAIPATMTFKTTKCNAARSVADAIEAASKPEWANESPAHKLAYAAFSRPFARVAGTVATVDKPKGNNPYVAARSIVGPATPSEWIALKNLMEDPGDKETKRASGKERLSLVAKAFRARLAEIGVNW